MNIAVLVAAWALYVEAAEENQYSSAQDVCNILTSLSAEGQMV